jgi:hypothetical protein
VTSLKRTGFLVAESEKLPVATGEKVAPSERNDTAYRPMFPFELPSCRGRYRRPDMCCADFMSMVRVCGSGAGVPPNLECQMEDVPASRTLLAGKPVAASLAVAVQPVRGQNGRWNLAQYRQLRRR